MQSNATEKTKSAPKRARIILAATILVGAVLLGVLGWWLLRSTDSRVQVGSTRYVVDIAKSTQERKQGLSGRHRMPDNHGMLFIFPKAGARCIWMKDMQFSLDVIWLDEQKRVVDMYENMAPETYPHSFCPSKPALYVIELNAGQVQANGIKEGQTVSF